MRRVAIALVFAVFFIAGVSGAIINPLPYIFQNGTTADATQVNADLAQIVNNVNTNVPLLLPAPSPPVLSALLSGVSQTFTTPLNGSGFLPLYLEVEMVGAGGGGGEGGAAGNGGDGTDTTFSTLTAGHGHGGTQAGVVGGAGGVVTGCNFSFSGADGSSAGVVGTSGMGEIGGQGGAGPNGGGAAAGRVMGAGSSPFITSGGGGSGGGATSVTGGFAGSGGGAGGYCRSFINPVSSSYIYTVGVGGAASSGTANHGAAGANGLITIISHWQ